MNYEKMYKQLKAEGDLLELFPFLTGEWTKDKKQFIEIQENVHFLDVDYDEYED